MAVSFLNRDVSDLCLGKPALRWWVAEEATVAEALSALKRSGESHVSVWRCTPLCSVKRSPHDCECVCVGKICNGDVIRFLCEKRNLENLNEAFEAKVSDILPKGSPIVRHVQPNLSLLEAIDHILEGTQNLVIPMENYNIKKSKRKPLNKAVSLTANSSHHNGLEYCWLTQEDVIRFLLNSIGVFSPLPAFTIESLNIIDHDFMAVHYHDPALSALADIHRSLNEQTSVAVTDSENRLIGEISPYTLALCDATVAAAITTLSTGDLMYYIDCGGPPDDLVQLVKTRLEEKKLGAMLELMEEYFPCSSSSCSASSCSSDDESGSSLYSNSGRYSSGRRSEAITCYPWSSLVAVMIQAIAHRVNCMWVVEEDHNLVGMVTFQGILKAFRGLANARQKEEKDDMSSQRNQ